jgi:predicted HicB family RNase H-like nuclease
MDKRMGRPPTGNKPRLSIRMEPEALRRANERAKAEGVTVGHWLEAAIREKLEREDVQDER